MSWIRRLARTLRAGRLEREIDEELSFHVEERIEELVRGGMPRAEAVRAVRRRFGNALQLREQSRDAQLLPWLDTLAADARFALRILRKDATVTCAAVLSLGLAIGACAAAFSLIDALILRKLPVRDPDSLCRLTAARLDGALGEDDHFSYPTLEEFRRRAAHQAELIGLTWSGGAESAAFEPGTVEKVRTQRISGAGFDLLGVPPATGRVLVAADDGPGRPAVAVLGYRFWQRRFGGDPAVLGRRFELGERQFEVVGVAQRGFDGTDQGTLTDLWVALRAGLSERMLVDQGRTPFMIWARLRPGVPREQVAALLQPAFREARRQLADTIPRGVLPAERVAAFVGTPLLLESAAHGGAGYFRMEYQRPLWILAMFAGLLWLTCCSNLSNLYVARAAARGREMAVRTAIGAGRSRLIRQLLVESSLLAGAACVFGLVFGRAAAPMIVSLLSPPEFPMHLDLRLDWRLLAFVAAVGTSAVLLYGTVPALRVSAVAPADALRTGGARSSSRLGPLRPLLAAQIGFSFTVLFVAGLLVVSFHRLARVDLGFSSERVALYRLNGKGGRDVERERVSQRQLLGHIRLLPGVEAAGMSEIGLVGGDFAWMAMVRVRFPGREPEPESPRILGISPGFVETMRIRLLDGRDFDPRDAGGAAVLVDETFARRYYPGATAVGGRFERFGERRGWQAHEIVGVVADTKYNNLRERRAPTIYFPMDGVAHATLAVRTAQDPAAMMRTVRREVQQADPLVTVDSTTLQSDQIAATLLRERLLAVLSGFFGSIALVLATVGLYGVLSYSAVRRTQELGIRVALGARPGTLVRLVAGQLAPALLAGVAAGVAGGMWLARAAAAFLFEIAPGDLASSALPLGLLIAACACAALGPLRRVARADPIVALRAE